MFDHDGKWTEGDTTTLQAVQAIRDAKMKGIPKAVLMALTIRASPRDGEMKCWPSLACLAKDAGFSVRSVIRAIDELMEFDASGRHGWHMLRKESGGPEETNTYILDFEAIMALPAHTPPRKKKRR